MLKIMGKKYLQFYTESFCLYKPVSSVFVFVRVDALRPCQQSCHVWTISCLPGFNQEYKEDKCLAQGHKAVPSVSLEPMILLSNTRPLSHHARHYFIISAFSFRKKGYNYFVPKLVGRPSVCLCLPQGQIMYFLVNVSPPKTLDIATSNFAAHRPHDVESTGQHFF